jgi:hypothetical protein
MAPVLFCLGLAGAGAMAAKPGTFVAAPFRKDMAYDASSGLLYISNGGSIVRYDTRTDTTLSPWTLGGSLMGMDLSPDGKHLTVADNTHSTDQVWVHNIALDTGVDNRLTFARRAYEGGTFSVAYGNDGSLLTTSTFEGYGDSPLRRYDPTAGTANTLGTVVMNSMLAASRDRSVIGFEESGVSDGPFGRYRVADHDLLRKFGYTDGTANPNFEIGVNPDGTQYTVLTTNGAYIYNASLQRVGSIGPAGAYQVPLGVAYSPTGNVAYFSFAGTPEVRAYDMATFQQVGAYDFGGNFGRAGYEGFLDGRLKLSPDGSMLFATINGGVRYIRIPSAVPEPGSLALIVLGLAPLALAAVRRARSAPARLAA